MNPPTIILTPGHTGSSAFCDILKSLGVWFGQCFEDQGKRFNENEFFVSMNRDFLEDDAWTYKNAFPDTLMTPYLQDDVAKRVGQNLCEKILSEGYEYGPWAVKDPRTVLTFEIWDKAFPNAVWLILDRNYDDIRKGMEVWMSYRLGRFDTLKHILYNRSHVVQYDDLTNNFDETLYKLGEVLGLDVFPATIEHAKTLWNPK